MTWFLNLSTRAKLLVSFGLMILFLAVVAGTAYLGIRTIQESQERLFEVDLANVGDLYAFEAKFNATRADTLTMMILDNRSDQATAHQNVKDYSREADGLLSKLLERNH